MSDTSYVLMGGRVDFSEAANSVTLHATSPRPTASFFALDSLQDKHRPPNQHQIAPTNGQNGTCYGPAGLLTKALRGDPVIRQRVYCQVRRERNTGYADTTSPAPVPCSEFAGNSTCSRIVSPSALVGHAANRTGFGDGQKASS